MSYELRRIWEIFLRYRIKFIAIWIISCLFSVLFYFISPPGYKSEAQIALKNTRKPWVDFQTAALPKRMRGAENEQTQRLTLRDPFWNFLYDQMEQSTYDFTPFFFARTIVFRVMDDVGCRSHFDNGAMDPDEIVLAFTDNLDIEFDRVNGLYNISYTFRDPQIAREIVNRYTELFMEFINQINLENNIPPKELLTKNVEKLQNEIHEIEMSQAELKKKTGIIAPAQYLTTLTAHLYAIEMRLVQADGRVKASRQLLTNSQSRISEMEKYSAGKTKTMTSPAKELLADPLLSIIIARVFWDSMNLTQASMLYQEGTPQVKYWSDRVETSKRLLMTRMAEDEKGQEAELIQTFTEESAKSLWLRQHKKETEDHLNRLPEVEKEYIYLHRKRFSKSVMLANFRDLQQMGESFIQKGEKIGTILNPAFTPKRKSDPSFLKIFLSIFFASTVSGFGWFFIRENIEVHSEKSDSC